jgi:hypothetical protein
MKESITKFDIEAAFKALDELDAPVAARGIKANRPALSEIFSRKSKFDSLFEEYYDVSNSDELSDAQAEREAEIAKAKLARIEKIVDLDADSPEDLLTSYVGKYIMQCPQCMTLFYKNKEDTQESEEDPSTVNVGEVCQHCGNESGYTLIGKVGAAEEPVGELSEPDGVENEITAETAEETVDTEISSTDGEDASDVDDADIDLDSELAELDLEIENDEDIEEEEKKEEAFNAASGNYLLEQLFEEADEQANMEDELEISSDEFKNLISSPEFKKPISNSEARAMLAELGEACSGKCTEENLTEGGLGLLGQTIKKNLKRTGTEIKNKASAAIDKYAENSMTRAEKAEWILANALEDSVKKVKVDTAGQLIPDQQDRKFNTFMVLGFKGVFSDGRPITAKPAINNKELVIDMPEPQFRQTYQEADDLANGLSAKTGGGPAFIYLAKDESSDNVTFLCGYFKGKLIHDHLEKYFELVKKDIDAKEKISSGGGIQQTGGGKNDIKTEKIEASAVTQGQQLIFNNKVVEVVETAESSAFAGKIAIKVKADDGKEETYTLNADAQVTVAAEDTTTESMNTKRASMSKIMEGIDNIKENVFEGLISKALIESYSNVAGFKLTDCAYVNNKLAIYGTVLFESGKTRNISYLFTEALSKDNKVTFRGASKKLGADKYFTVSGKTEKNTFIAESLRVSRTATR